MRSKIIGFLIGCGLAAIVAPALACSFGTTAENSQSTSQQTAQSQPASDTARTELGLSPLNDGRSARAVVLLGNARAFVFARPVTTRRNAGAKRRWGRADPAAIKESAT